VVGLPKLNRIVQYYAQLPQVQERLTMQIANELRSVPGTDDVAGMIEATHLCVSARGVKDVSSSTVMAGYPGKFPEENTRNEL